jgi:hypothetical protein
MQEIILILHSDRLDFIVEQLFDQFPKMALSNLGILVINKVIPRTENEEHKMRIVQMLVKHISEII